MATDSSDITDGYCADPDSGSRLRPDRGRGQLGCLDGERSPGHLHHGKRHTPGWTLRRAYQDMLQSQAPTSPSIPLATARSTAAPSSDCFSRMIVARTFSTTPDTALVNNAIDMAVVNRNRCGSTIVHSVHGSQFTSWSFGENVRRWGLLASFGTVGDCYENAVNGGILGPDASRVTQHPQMGDHAGTGRREGRRYRQLLLSTAAEN